jgi:putative PIN family toxin of toxin-antitoxin system
MRFVIDTNLLVSGVITAGRPRQLLQAARSGEFELCTSEVLLAELQRVLGRAKFANRLDGLTPEGIVADLHKLVLVVAPTSVPRVVPTDPDDDVLAVALAGAQALVDQAGVDLRQVAAALRRLPEETEHQISPIPRYSGRFLLSKE